MLRHLRTFGFVLLFTGFLWLCWDCFLLRPLLRPVIGAHFAHVPKDTQVTMTRRELLGEIHDVAVDVLDKQPFFLYPGGTMLVAALILAFAPRYRSSVVPTTTSNQSLQPTAGRSDK